MTQIIVIGLVLTLLAHDAMPIAPEGLRLPWQEIVGLTLLPQAALAGFVHAWVWRCGRRIDRTGRGLYVASADAAVAMGRWASLAFHAVAVLGLGWLDLVRSTLGDWVLVDEAVATLPPLLTLAFGWASYASIDSRLRQAAFFGAVERGEPVYPGRTTWQYVSDQVRGQALFLLIPMGMALAWVELLNLVALRLEQRSPLLLDSQAAGIAFVVAQLAGSIAVFLVSPVIIRRVWSATRMGPGALRERLDALCRAQGVTHRGLLVWNTHGAMLNAAVLGLVGPLRYILLSDALLDHLSDRQVEAVLAHEMGHVRRRHMPWLVAGLAACMTVGAAVAGVAEAAALRLAADAGLLAGADPATVAAALAMLGLVVSLVIGLAGVGYISRRFEWQADAFAVQRLAGADRHDGPAGLVISPDAADAMIGALREVARRNFIPLRKNSWRHGSIAERMARLEAIVGMRADALPIDRHSRRIKRVIAVCVAGIVLWAILAPAIGR